MLAYCLVHLSLRSSLKPALRTCESRSGVVRRPGRIPISSLSTRPAEQTRRNRISAEGRTGFTPLPG